MRRSHPRGLPPPVRVGGRRHIGDGRRQDIDDPGQLGIGDRQRRHDDDHVAQRAQQHPAANGAGAHPAAPPQPGIRGRQLDAGHEPPRPDLADRRQRGDPLVEQTAEGGGPGPHVGEDVPLLEQLEVAQRHRRRQGVPAVGVPVIEGPVRQVRTKKGPVDTVARRGGGHGQVAAGEPLAEREQVGAQPALLRGEQRAGAPEPGGHLVGDQQHVVAPAGVDQRPVRTRIGDQHPRRPLHEGFDHDRRQRGTVLVDQGGGAGEGIRGVVAGRPDHVEAQRVEQVGAEAASTQGQRPDGVTVVGVTEGQVTGAAGDAEVGPVLEGDLERLLHRRGAVRGEQQVRPVDGHHAGQRLGELDDHAVAVAEQRRMGHPVELAAQRLVELRDPMAERRDPERRDGVEVAATVDVDQLTSLGRFDDDRLVVDVARHLGEPVPDHRGVPGAPGCCIAHGLAACQRPEGWGESGRGRRRAAGRRRRAGHGPPVHLSGCLTRG